MFLRRGILIVLLSIGIIGIAGTGYYFYQNVEKAIPVDIVIDDYNEVRDKAEILDIFTVDRYWLLSSVDYSPEFMLAQKAPDKYQSEYFGKLKIKVLRDKGEFGGFTAYYPKNFAVGQLLFLATKRSQRKKGYGKMLVDFVEADMKKMGLKKVKLHTRVDNVRSRALYTKCGFTLVPIEDDPTHVDFEKSLT